MTLTEALEILVKSVPERFPVGYWERDGEYIFHTKGSKADDGLAVPAQFVVTKKGEVYGTNPIESDLDNSNMKKIRGLFR